MVAIASIAWIADVATKNIKRTKAAAIVNSGALTWSLNLICGDGAQDEAGGEDPAEKQAEQLRYRSLAHDRAPLVGEQYADTRARRL
jgi:hypothetical protein